MLIENCFRYSAEKEILTQDENCSPFIEHIKHPSSINVLYSKHDTMFVLPVEKEVLARAECKKKKLSRCIVIILTNHVFLLSIA